jgi:hypothetical protein
VPITRKQFEAGVDDQIEARIRQIHTYLAEKRDQAFTAEELQAAILGSSWEYNDAFRAALQKLVEIAAVELRRIGNESYYAYQTELIGI